MKRRERLRKTAGGWAAKQVFSSLPKIAQLTPAVRNPEAFGVERFRDIPYRDTGDPAHRLDVYRLADDHRPRLGAPAPLRPIVFYVHGGGFRILSKETHSGVAVRHAQRHCVVFNVEYRRSPQNRFPAALQDVYDAFLWVMEHAERYGGDPRRIVFGGESAGANLVTALTIACAWRRPEPWARRVFDVGVTPRAVVAACGILQVSQPERFRRPGGASWFVQDRIEEVSVGYLPDNVDVRTIPLADPLIVLEQADAPDRPLPPFFAPVGTGDVLVDDTRRLEAALTRLGAECRARYYPGEMHGFHGLVWRTAARDCWRELLDFVDHRVR